ncbi:NAD-dependent epimerase/dehydratase family protein, partial [Candidatus Nomurabacteria bacterium]|nr:NAD-dependent epimerase/dehydratase family protein [Candidatus Nomurabacteria bacterium]
MSTHIEEPRYLPITAEEKERLGIDTFDIIIISGDAYVDHPSFAAAILGRNLWSAGYTVGIISQPDWRREEDFLALGIPRLFFAVSAGNVDSMVNAFTPNKKRRSEDTYSPGGIPKRPDRATIVYTNKLRSLAPDSGIVIGGIEASLRRFAHYDYWSDSVRQSLLADAPADLLVYGMGERTLRLIADRMNAGEPIRSLFDIPGTCRKMPVAEWRTHNRDDMVILPGYTEVKADPKQYAEDPIGTILTNIDGCNNLLRLALEKKARFLLASSVEIYGQGTEKPMDEHYCGYIDCNQARAGYNEAKRTCEALTQSYR